MAVLLVPHNTLTLYLKFNIPPSLVPPAPNHPPPAASQKLKRTLLPKHRYNPCIIFVIPKLKRHLFIFCRFR